MVAGRGGTAAPGVSTLTLDRKTHPPHAWFLPRNAAQCGGDPAQGLVGESPTTPRTACESLDQVAEEDDAVIRQSCGRGCLASSQDQQLGNDRELL